MDTAIDRIRQLHAERLRLCDELIGCLGEERTALIALDMDVVVQCTVRKDGLGHRLVRSHNELKAALGDTLPEGWPEMHREWTERWEQVSTRLASNQRLIGRSLKSLGLVVDNLKRLFGDTPLYSAQGRAAHAPRYGKVVEKRL